MPYEGDAVGRLSHIGDAALDAAGAHEECAEDVRVLILLEDEIRIDWWEAFAVPSE